MKNSPFIAFVGASAVCTLLVLSAPICSAKDMEIQGGGHQSERDPKAGKEHADRDNFEKIIIKEVAKEVLGKVGGPAVEFFWPKETAPSWHADRPYGDLVPPSNKSNNNQPTVLPSTIEAAPYWPPYPQLSYPQSPFYAPFPNYYGPPMPIPEKPRFYWFGNIFRSINIFKKKNSSNEKSESPKKAKPLTNWEPKVVGLEEELRSIIAQSEYNFKKMKTLPDGEKFRPTSIMEGSSAPLTRILRSQYVYTARYSTAFLVSEEKATADSPRREWGAAAKERYMIIKDAIDRVLSPDWQSTSDTSEHTTWVEKRLKRKIFLVRSTSQSAIYLIVYGPKEKPDKNLVE